MAVRLTSEAPNNESHGREGGGGESIRKPEVICLLLRAPGALMARAAIIYIINPTPP